MKLRHLLPILAMTALVRCASPQLQQAQDELPAQRPADFQIGFIDKGAPGGPTVEFRINGDEGYYRTFEAGIEHSWVNMIEPQQLDSLYAIVRENDLLHLQSIEEVGSNPDRFGSELLMKWAGHQVEIADQGNRYLQTDEDYGYFLEVTAAIRACVGSGLQHQMHVVRSQLILEKGLPKTDSILVDLEATNMINLPDGGKGGDTVAGEARSLRGMYRLNASFFPFGLSI